ncbi:hypothetical protein EDB92DRAFT_1817169 [Lactarius akahatsu]|uniref:Uncharacterized protein n=1 Tax=Lactarius akahatsu TaxID=416441 RepID=A0AAD4LFN3_9AGAM|nr:hypothetical protein EDB92DRAFT_1817169 [Lactarius akahatsu]
MCDKTPLYVNKQMLTPHDLPKKGRERAVEFVGLSCGQVSMGEKKECSDVVKVSEPVSPPVSHANRPSLNRTQFGQSNLKSSPERIEVFVAMPTTLVRSRARGLRGSRDEEGCATGGWRELNRGMALDQRSRGERGSQKEACPEALEVRRRGRTERHKRDEHRCTHLPPALLLSVVTSHLYLNYSSGERVRGWWQWARGKRVRQQVKQGECVREEDVRSGAGSPSVRGGEDEDTRIDGDGH